MNTNFLNKIYKINKFNVVYSMTAFGRTYTINDYFMCDTLAEARAKAEKYASERRYQLVSVKKGTPKVYASK